MAELLPVPEVAAGATEVVVSNWLVQVGDTFSAGDLIAVIETEKAVVELPAEQNGTLLRILAKGGSQVEVGAPMALIGGQEDRDADVDELLRRLGVAASDDTGPASPRAGSTVHPQPALDEPAFSSEESVPLPRAAEQVQVPLQPNGRVFVSPIARRLLRDAGVSAETIAGSGPHGRILRRDVEAALARAAAEARSVGEAQAALEAVPSAPTPAESTPAPATAEQSWTDVPHSRMRRAVATRLTQSKQQTPHFYVRRVVELDALLALRASVNEDASVRISVNDFLIKAIAHAHKAVPDANVVWTDDAVRRFDPVDISVAIASDRGLVTPVLRAVEQTSITSIATQVRAYVDKANAGRLQQHELEGGSITISNLGMFGVDEFSAIINPPQSAILAVSAAQPTVLVKDGAPAVATCANLVLSVDHRAIDGALAAQWMAALVEAVERPMRLLL